MSTLHLLSYDPLLAELISTELRALGQPALSIGEGDTPLPADATLLFIDLDTVQTLPQTALPTVAVTRREDRIPQETRARFAAVLHRPFAITVFRDTVTALLTPPSVEPQRKERLRLTARRSGKASASPIRFDAATDTLLVEKARIALTKGESTVLSLLISAAGRPVPRTALLEALSAGDGSNLPDVHVCAIRKKLRPHGKEHLLRTVRGIGYAFSEA